MGEKEYLLIECHYLEGEGINPYAILEIDGLLQSLSEFEGIFKSTHSQHSKNRLYKMQFWDYCPEFINLT